MTRGEDVATTPDSKKMLCPFCWLQQLIVGVIITQWISWPFLPTLLHTVLPKVCLGSRHIGNSRCAHSGNGSGGPGSFWVLCGVIGGIFSWVVPSGTVWLFANEAEVVSEAVTFFNRD